jgi:hypothetical protein
LIEKFGWPLEKNKNFFYQKSIFRTKFPRATFDSILILRRIFVFKFPYKYLHHLLRRCSTLKIETFTQVIFHKYLMISRNLKNRRISKFCCNFLNSSHLRLPKYHILWHFSTYLFIELSFHLILLFATSSLERKFHYKLTCETLPWRRTKKTIFLQCKSFSIKVNREKLFRFFSNKFF